MKKILLTTLCLLTSLPVLAKTLNVGFVLPDAESSGSHSADNRKVNTVFVFAKTRFKNSSNVTLKKVYFKKVKSEPRA